MKKIALFFMLVARVSFAQTDCNCAQNFQILQQKVKSNYAGYDSRVTEKNKLAFEQLTDSIAKASAAVTEGYDCFTLMERWVSFFKDGHLYLLTKFSSKSKPTTTEGPKMTTVDSATFYQYLAKNKAQLEPLEGVWGNDDGSYTVAIKRDLTAENTYQATILKAKSEKWKTGIVKFNLKKEKENWKAQYYASDFSSMNLKTTLNENLLIFDQFGVWEKQYPEPKIKLDAAQFAMDQMVTFKMIDEKTAYLSVSTFNNGSDLIDSVINKNRAKILATPRLIIDIRGNGGGSNSSYKGILPFMYTQPYTAEEKGGYVLASEDNIVAEKKIYDQIWNNLSVESKKANAKEYADWKGYLDSMSLFKGSRFYFAGEPPTKYDSVTTNPKQVAVLMDKGCASSAEWFILEAEFSKKVTLFGQNSAGIMDNTNVRSHKLACPSFTIYAASGRRGGAKTREIDNIGFKPQVAISEKEEDWVKVVLEHWKKL
jgi:Peptidase family S41